MNCFTVWVYLPLFWRFDKATALPLHCRDDGKVKTQLYSPVTPALPGPGGVVANDWCISIKPQQLYAPTRGVIQAYIYGYIFTTILALKFQYFLGEGPPNPPNVPVIRYPGPPGAYIVARALRDC